MTSNEEIYRQALEKILLEIEYGEHEDLPNSFTDKVSYIINETPIEIALYPQGPALGICIK